MNGTKNTGEFFKRFKRNVEEYKLPEKFTFPFNYVPHPLCKIAAQELQYFIEKEAIWEHDFGLNAHSKKDAIGKMFGVLLVSNKKNEIGYLTAFSGKIDNKNHYPGFVPPLFDILDENGFYRIEEDNITEINKEIEALKKSPEYILAKKKLEETKKYAKKDLAINRDKLKAAKRARKELRDYAEKNLSSLEFEELKETLKNDSLKGRYDYKDKARVYTQKIAELEANFYAFENIIIAKKKERKERSAILQQKLFDQYEFLNNDNITKNVRSIFENTAQKTPPSGAGECAAPRLLQFAFANNYKPLAIAEFWWGKSPNSEIRKHKHFYPSCRSKCEPILGHMLQGIAMDENPAITNALIDKEITVLYEDEAIAIINKPHEFLSVPGKTQTNSVQTKVQKLFPHASGPLIVHRLDMSTSGILIIAKTKDAHKHLQNQFLEKTISKRYVAILDGIINADSGTIELPLRVDLDNRPRQLVCYEYGKFAKTKWEVIERKNGKTKVFFYPITGRTHQLRVHAAHSKGLNTPILGDDLYGEKGERLFLHAQKINFIHPTTQKELEFICEDSFADFF